MASIYDINRELEDIFLELDENGGELTPELEERLKINQQNLNDKLNDYRKAYTTLSLEADNCRKEEQRIAALRKTKQNNADRLKNVMLEAVINYGDCGKSGNKVINLVDSKLYTRNSNCVEIDGYVCDIFVDLVFEQLEELWDNDMLDPNINGTLNNEEFIKVINEKLVSKYPFIAEKLKEETGEYFTINDLYAIDIKMELEYPLEFFLKMNNFDVVNAYFNHKIYINRIINMNKVKLSNLIKNCEGGVNIAKIVSKPSLIIK